MTAAQGHECAYDTPGAGPCETCLTTAAEAIEDRGQQSLAVGWRCDHDFSGATCAWCFSNIDHAREVTARIVRDLIPQEES